VRKLVIFCLACLVIVGGMTIWVNRLGEKVAQVNQKLEEEHEQLATALRELDRKHPAPPDAENDARIGKALHIRQFVSQAWEELGSPARREAMGGRIARNAMLHALCEGLTAEEMGPTEYRGIVQRLSVDPELATRYATEVAGGMNAPEIEPELDRILGTTREPAAGRPVEGAPPAGG